MRRSMFLTLLTENNLLLEHIDSLTERAQCLLFLLYLLTQHRYITLHCYNHTPRMWSICSTNMQFCRILHIADDTQFHDSYRPDNNNSLCTQLYAPSSPSRTPAHLRGTVNPKTYLRSLILLRNLLKTHLFLWRLMSALADDVNDYVMHLCPLIVTDAL